MSRRRIKKRKTGKISKNKVFSGIIFFYNIVAVLLIVIFLSVSGSFLFTYLGNQALDKDVYKRARYYYSIANFLNPLNKTASQGKAIASVIAEERNRELDVKQGTQVHISELDVTLPISPVVTGTEQQDLKQAVAAGRTILIPVLMYHYIRVNPYESDKVGFGLSVTPYNFNAQLDYLAAHGYHTVTLDEFGAALLEGAKLPEKPIIITIDDGYRDSYTDALPALKAHGMKAVNFVVTSFVNGPRYLTWEMMDEMYKSGAFTFEAHTVNHLALTYSSNEVILKELKDSKSELEAHLGYPVNWFAYPYGNVDTRVAGLVPQAGFVGAFGTNPGLFESTNYIYTLPRIRIGGGDSVDSFANKLPWR